jgi:hypothetical protein
VDGKAQSPGRQVVPLQHPGRFNIFKSSRRYEHWCTSTALPSPVAVL